MRIWLHSENGFPHPKSFKAEHLRALSKVLKLRVAEIQEAIDASRVVYAPGEVPMPQASADAFKAFIDILDNDKRTVVKMSYVRNLARTSTTAPRARRPDALSVPPRCYRAGPRPDYNNRRIGSGPEGRSDFEVPSL